MPRLSVLMTAYNAQETLARAVTSTLRAIPQDAELVVHDDGSSDRTPQVLDGISDSRLRRLTLVGNLGYARARSRLVAQSDSQVIAIMDADDVTMPWRFRAQLRLLRRADAVVSPVIRFSTSPLQVRPGLPGPLSADTIRFLLAFGCPLAHPTLLLKRSALNAAGGYRDVIAEDYDLYLRLLTEGRLLAQGAVYTLAYRQHPGQTSRKHGFDELIRKDVLFQTAYTEFVESSFGFQRQGDATLLNQDEAEALLRVVPARLNRIASWRVRRYAEAVGAVSAG